MISTMSMAQALSVWADLEDAMRGGGSHGYAAEIYAHRLVPVSPLVAFGPANSELVKQSQREMSIRASENLTALVVAFCKRRDTKAYLVTGRDESEWVRLGERDPVPMFDHRVQIGFKSEEA